MVYQNVRGYLEQFVSIKKSLEGFPTLKGKNDYWCEIFLYWSQRYPDATGNDIVNLNYQGLALIHPEFCYDREGHDIRERLDTSRTMVVLPHERDSKCQMSLIFQDECVFDDHRELRGQLKGDHYWPYSLGGPTNTIGNLHTNRLILCDYCNSTKSSSILNYKFTKKIDWLHERLSKIYTRKAD